MPAKKEGPAESKAAASDNNLIAALSYIFGPIIALIIYLIKKDDKFVKFHALQAMVFDVVAIVLYVGLSIVFYIAGIALAAVTYGIGGLLMFCPMLIMLVFAVAALYAAYMAFQGKMYKLPMIGDFAAKYV